MKNLIFKLTTATLVVLLSIVFGLSASAENNYSECPQIMNQVAENMKNLDTHIAKAALFCLEREMHQTQITIDNCLVNGNIFCVTNAKHDSKIIGSIITKMRNIAQGGSHQTKSNLVAQLSGEYKKL